MSESCTSTDDTQMSCISQEHPVFFSASLASATILTLKPFHLCTSTKRHVKHLKVIPEIFGRLSDNRKKHRKPHRVRLKEFCLRLCFSDISRLIPDFFFPSLVCDWCLVPFKQKYYMHSHTRSQSCQGMLITWWCTTIFPSFPSRAFVQSAETPPFEEITPQDFFYNVIPPRLSFFFSHQALIFISA